jgi:hypothetical protein
MKTIKYLLIISLIVLSCNTNKKIGGVYRNFFGTKDGYKIWIVDGNIVRQKIYKEFLYGGNEQRYLFNPKGEIWIDNAISCEEFDLTVAHELNERHLMAKFGWEYQAAHDSSLSLELTIRRKNEEVCRAHEASLKKVAVTDYENKKEIKYNPDSIRLQNIYRIPLGTREDISIWVVDAYLVRKTIYPDFGFSGNDLVYHFIPRNEIWIDGQVSCEETEYSISVEMTERRLMTEGKSYSDSYEAAVGLIREKREKMEAFVKSMNLIVLPDSLERDAGIIDRNEK